MIGDETLVPNLEAVRGEIYAALLAPPVTAATAAALADQPYGVYKVSDSNQTVLWNGESVVYTRLTTENAQLIEWVEGEAFQPTTLNRDNTNRVITAGVQWPDGSAGTFTVLAYGDGINFRNVMSYKVTHTASGKTITQPTVTRDAQGKVTAKPLLAVTP